MTIPTLSDPTATASERRPVSAAIGRALRHIDQCFAEPVTLHDLSAIAGMNLFTLIKQFRQEVGVTPHRHLCRVRVRAAQDLLGTGLRPALAAIEAGFFDQSHLARHFKRHCGITPGQYAAAVALARAAA